MIKNSKNLVFLGGIILGFEWVICYTQEDELRGHILCLPFFIVCTAISYLPVLIYLIKYFVFRIMYLLKLTSYQTLRTSSDEELIENDNNQTDSLNKEVRTTELNDMKILNEEENVLNTSNNNSQDAEN